jgi:hypothetical protein
MSNEIRDVRSREEWGRRRDVSLDAFEENGRVRGHDEGNTND